MKGIAFALLAAAAAMAADPHYRADIEKWRKQQASDLLAADGPLSLVARIPLSLPKTTVGRDSTSNAVIPVASAPARAGVIELSGNKAILRIASAVRATVGGKPVQAVEFKSEPATAKPVRASIGDVQLEIRWPQGAPQLLVRNAQSELRRGAHPPRWFPVDERYRVTGVFMPFDKPRKMTLPDSNGLSRTWDSPGTVRFRIGRDTVTLQPFQSGGELVFVFRDGTSGKESYGAGRILEAGLPKAGKVILDFNKAYNPLCAYNPLSICPRPSKENILSIPIRAGEMKYSDH